MILTEEYQRGFAELEALEVERKEVIAFYEKFMDENPMHYKTPQSVFYKTVEGRSKILNMTDDELWDFFKEAYPDRPFTKREQEETKAYFCRKYPNIPVSIIIQFLKVFKYGIVGISQALEEWIICRCPAKFKWEVIRTSLRNKKTESGSFEVACPQHEGKFGIGNRIWDPERLPQLEYYQVVGSRIIRQTLQHSFILKKTSQRIITLIVESDDSKDKAGDSKVGEKQEGDKEAGKVGDNEKRASKTNDKEVGINEAGNDKAGDNESGANEAYDKEAGINEAGDSDKALPK